MIFRVTMKDPDTLSDAIYEAANADLKNNDTLTEDDRQALLDSRCENARDIARKWFEYGEYLTIEIDTDAKTATVVPRT